MLNLVGSGHRPDLGIFDKYVQGLKDLATHKVLFQNKNVVHSSSWYILSGRSRH